MVQDDARPLIDTAPVETGPQEVKQINFSSSLQGSLTNLQVTMNLEDTQVDEQEDEQEAIREDIIDTTVPVEGDSVLDFDNEELDEDISEPLVGDDPASLDAVDQDEMTAAEETAVVETEIEPGPSTPTDIDRRTDGM